MTSPNSVQISPQRAAGRADRLLRSAITAFCSITRPSRREIAQLDDLALPLLDRVSTDTLRFVAAALSESTYAPPSLVRRLSDQPIEICAPLLIGSPVLTSIDLVALIGRHGAGHASAIARRHQLDPRIVRLITTISDLGADETSLRLAEARAAERREETALSRADAVSTAAEATRNRLRSMMRPASEIIPAAPALRWEGYPGAYRKLRSTALTGVAALFQTALADTLAISVAAARDIAESSDISRLIVALRALSMTEEQAFFIVQCVWPARFGTARTITAFVDAFNGVNKDDAERLVSQWRATPDAAIVKPRFDPAHVATANQPARERIVKAS